MRLPFGLEITRSRKQDAPTAAAGVDAPAWYSEVLSGGPDLNPELTGRRKYEQFQEMRLSDSSVRSALWMEKLPIRAATWDLIPPDDADPVDRLIADACEKQLGIQGRAGWLDVSFDALLQQWLLYLDWGAMFFEPVFARDLVEWRDADGDTHLIRPIVRIAPRMPATIEAVDIDPATGRIRSLRQWVPGAKPIPGDRVIHIALEPEPGNPFGISMLRAMWGPWRLKKATLLATGIGYDRWSAGLPVIRHPTGEENRRLAEEIGRNLRQHERAYVTLEGAEPYQGSEGWSLTLEKGQIEDPTGWLHYLNYSIGEAALQQFSKLGTTERGARAVGEVLADPYYLAVASVAGQIAEELQRQVLRRFVDHNFGRELDLPRLRVSKIQARNVEVMARALADLADAGLNFTDRETQNDVRDLFDFPHLPEEVGVERTPSAPTPAPGEEGGGLPQE